MIKARLKKWLFAEIEQEVRASIFKEQNVAFNDTMKVLQFAFMTSDGVKWYKYKDELDMPIERYEQSTISLHEMQARIHREDLELWIDAATKILEDKDVSAIRRDVSIMLGKLKERLELLYEPEMMMRLLAGIYIREDQIEHHHVWNPILEEEKFEFLMKEKANGLAVFFCERGLQAHFNHSGQSMKESEKLMTNGLQQNQLFRKLLRQVTTNHGVDTTQS